MINNQKRVGTHGIFLIVVMSALAIALFSSPALADDVYNTTHPIITVSYHEIPVTVTYFNLTDLYGTPWNVYVYPINYPLSGLDVYNFTVDFLDNGDYNFTISAIDQDDNERNASKLFRIAHDDLQVRLVDPIPAIGKTQIFNITIGTQYVATCRWGMTNPDGCQDQICRYINMAHPADVTGNRTTHTIVYAASGSDKTMYVVCRSDASGANLTDESNYGGTHFMAGYDLQPPIIDSAEAQPNPVVDFYNKSTTVNVATSEPTVCHIEGNSSMPESHIDTYFPGEDPYDYNSYVTEHSIPISYYYIDDPIPFHFLYDITCNDRAKWLAQKNLSVVVRLNTSLSIRQVTPEFVGQLDIPYEVETSVAALGCDMKLNDEADWVTMYPNTMRNYTRDVSLILGDNHIQVRCDSEETTYANFTVTADNQPPTMELSMYTETCSLSEINFEMIATDEGSGVEWLNYSIWHGSDMLQDWTLTTDPTQTWEGNLEDGETYTVKANAIDYGGLQSYPNAEQSIIAHGSGSPNCDFTNPTVTLNVTGDTYQKDVDVICHDNLGCADYFNYEAIPGIMGSCNDSTYPDTYQYTALPLSFTSDTYLCVKVSDLHGNTATAQRSIPVQTIICGNDLRDPGEACDGTDLGGFTCNNFGFDGGILSCKSDCSGFNTDNCADQLGGYCGDDIINHFDWEQCDGTAWGGISHVQDEGCQQFGFDSGDLSCNPSSMPIGQRCMFNTSECVKNPTNPLPRCDGYGGTSTTLLDPSEQCELTKPLTLTCSDFDSFGGGDVSCTDSCMYDISQCEPPPNPAVCGNGIPEPTEECDPPGSLKSCDLFPGYTGDDAICMSDCTYDFSACDVEPECGNGIREGQEQCDGIDTGTVQCTDIDNNTGGTLGCNADCTFDETNCNRGAGFCGDNLINNPFVEQCDNNSWGGISHALNTGCQQFGFNGGTLSCRPPGSVNQCTFDTSQCTDNSPLEDCGDRTLQSGEQCETGKDFTLTCADFDGYTGGNLACNYGTCLFMLDGCNHDPLCGNGRIDAGETCDGTNFGDFSDCSDIRPTLQGPLSCFPQGSEHECQLDESSCTAVGGNEVCGDNVVNNLPNEECDGTDLNGLTCTNLGFVSGSLSCYAAGTTDECHYNTDNCVPEIISGYCGDGNLNTDETCDPGMDPLPLTCYDFDNSQGGTLGCFASGPDACTYDLTGCIPPPEPGYCGDSIINNYEECDGTNVGTMTCLRIGNYTGGILGCYPPDYPISSLRCSFDKSNCEIAHAGFCGDNIINNFPNEQCDGTSWGNIHTCEDLGFFGGTLQCNGCMFDTSQCIDDAPPGYCGNEILNTGEQCEPARPLEVGCSDFDHFNTGQLHCNDECQFNIGDCSITPDPNCGNGVIDQGEQCDGTPIEPSDQCSIIDDRYTSGTVGCNAPGTLNECMYDMSGCSGPGITNDSYCGDGEVTGYEQCDGTNLRTTCEGIGQFTGGTLSCFPQGDTNECMWDTSNCDLGWGFCGDGLINNLWQEQCDGTNWGGITSCNDMGFTGGGTLSCNPPGSANQCMFDTSQCNGITGYCGDQVVNPGEECEYNRDLSNICTDFDDFIGGLLGCDYSTCQYDLFDCILPTESVCGDGLITGNEECDGGNLGSNTQCTDFGNQNFIGGTVGCYPVGSGSLSCQYDLTGCIVQTNETQEYCGDGLLNDFPNEQCDMGTNGIQCTDFSGFTGGTLSCVPPGSADQCTFDTSQCTSPYGTGTCGDGELNGDEQCEPGQGLDLTCTDIGFQGGTLSCNGVGTAGQCMLNIDNCQPAINQGYCGDGYVIPDQEWCDSNNLGGLDCSFFEDFTDGILSCYPAGTPDACYWDTSNCNAGWGYCGDGLINNPFNEQCDGTNWGRITSCEDFGFQGGTLSCYDPSSPERCTFDTSQCTTPVTTKDCGDGLLGKGEQCDPAKSLTLGCTDFDSFIGGSISCDGATCKYVLNGCKLPSASVCGDGFITGQEECDGLNFAGLSLCTSFDTEFTGGSVLCNPPGSSRPCKFDLSDCEYTTTPAICGNNIIESGEECDGSENFLTCADFGMGQGFLGCDDCSVNTTSCTGNPTLNQVCGDDQLQPSEECDGSIDSLDSELQQSFIDLYQCQYGIGCSDTCTIDCLSQITYTCDNLVKDGDETGFNCGGSCPPCDAGEACVDNSDCKSGKCFEGECQQEQCQNGVQDADESGIDCGGSCPACPTGEGCFSDNDCQSGVCLNGICDYPLETPPEQKANPVGIALIIAGIVLMLGGGGYIVYEEYFDEKRHAAARSALPPMGQPRLSPPVMRVDPKILEMQKKKQEERRREHQDERKSLLEGFEKESAPKSPDDLEKLKEKKVNEDVLKKAGYIDLTEEKPAEKKSSDVFDQLRDISSGRARAAMQEPSVASEDQPQDGTKSGSAREDADTSSGSSSSRRPKIIKVKRKSDTFKKLGDIGKDVSQSQIQSTSRKISDLSGKSKGSVSRVLNSDSISQKQAGSIFSNLTKEKLTSDAFRDAVTDLVKSGKMDKETVSSLLFEYMDQGVLGKSDVAKIMSQLNMV